MTDLGIIKRLNEALSQLEVDLTSAKAQLIKKEPTYNHLLSRVDSYFELLHKQRQLVSSLETHIKTENWDEVWRHIALINELAIMIRDDSREALGDYPFVVEN